MAVTSAVVAGCRRVGAYASEGQRGAGQAADHRERQENALDHYFLHCDDASRRYAVPRATARAAGRVPTSLFARPLGSIRVGTGILVKLLDHLFHR